MGYNNNMVNREEAMLLFQLQTFASLTVNDGTYSFMDKEEVIYSIDKHMFWMMMDDDFGSNNRKKVSDLMKSLQMQDYFVLKENSDSYDIKLYMKKINPVIQPFFEE